MPVWAAILIGLILGTILGLINGLIVTRIRTFPLIVTLATSVIFQGISYMVSQARTFRDYPESFQFITKARLFGIPFDVYLTIFIVIVVVRHLLQDQVGHQGGRARAATKKRCGWPGSTPGVIKTLVYTVMRLLHRRRHHGHGLEGQLDAVVVRTGHRVHSSDRGDRRWRELPGRRGEHPALVAGVFVLAVLGNGMQLAGWGTYAQFIVRGIILLGAVAFDEYQKNARLKAKTH